MTMAAASSTEDNNKGFNFDFTMEDHNRNNHCDDFFDVNNAEFCGDNGDADGDDIGIDFELFYKILDEEPPQQQQLQQSSLPELPNNPFYPLPYNSQESGSGAHLGDPDNSPFSSDYFAASDNSAETVVAREQRPCASPPDISLAGASEASFWKDNLGPGLHHMPDYTKTECFPLEENLLGSYDMSASPGLSNQSPHDAGIYGRNSGHEVESSDTWNFYQPSLGSKVPVYDFFDGRGPASVLHDNVSTEKIDTVTTYDSSSTTTDEASTEPSYWGPMCLSRCKQAVEMKAEKPNELLIFHSAVEMKDEKPGRLQLLHSAVEMKDEKPNELHFLGSLQGKSRSVSKYAPFEGVSSNGAAKFFVPSEAHHSGGLVGHPDVFYHTDHKSTSLQRLESGTVFGNLCYKEGMKAVALPAKMLAGTSDEGEASLSENRCYSEAADDDLYVIEGMSGPAQNNQLLVQRKSVPMSLSTFSPLSSQLPSPLQQAVVSGTKLKATDERLIFQAAVQDLSQPRSEATPPDGLLTVPLLRHQRIALSWMVQKETSSLQCSGGILADDQGLGKTVSTIALILTERPLPSSTAKKSEPSVQGILNLDDEDDNQTIHRVSIDSAKASSARGRPSAGTLIVCPTSVLRQWAEELRSKVSSKANLSVHVYHGNNRTRDPYELAKYDVVLTTYSIVSMEVPKQPVVVKDGSGKRKLQEDDNPGSSSRKRKHSSSDKKRSNREIDNVLLECEARPLARVGWFRVVLDEAQSIKNHRTQVAQACWGLRAKRRWCLSGTPIQNAVDDLYSYFRFLRYDPYSVYNLFCTMVKLPISKHPSTGYKKLQAVLKTCMLRRTKGTLLDGEPIISLPPKSVMLKKVDFSVEERDFYTRLEADSRAQFQAYADSGTVKQNYVNILLMLLRLRQACDHPFLVQGYDSSSLLKPSITTAKKLPREQLISLLNCLEGSLAICGICSDPPEDAVVSICGHVFCNECISERLAGEDNQCPVINCKSQLNISSVFPKGTLKSCLSDNFSEEGSNNRSGSESSLQGELVEPCRPIRFDSSKIKAALEVLLSLSKPRASVPDTVLMGSVTPDAVPFNASNSKSCGSDNESCAGSNSSVSANYCVKEKAIVFSQWTRMLDLLEDRLKESSIVYRRLDGTMSVGARDKAVRDFNTVPEVSVMIMSLKAASLGLNMVAACHVLLLDLWWNPTTEDQAIDRAHRIGQTRPVTVVRLTVKDTVEDRILALQQKKRQLVASAFGEDEKGSCQTRLTVEDLKYLFMA